MDIKTEIKIKTEEIERVISEYLPPEEGYQKNLAEAMNYSVRAGGKRLRPMLMLEVFGLFGGEGRVIEPFMAAMELIHTASLVHDDLPAMDNDEYRRGKLTTHAVYGEAMGVLAGDALLNYAYEVASRAFDLDPSPNVGKAMRILAEKAGLYGMMGGQNVDLESEGKRVGIDVIEFIHRKKCGALIEGAMLIGAVLAGASESQQRLIEGVGADIGYAFQIRDDILDVIGDGQTLGKPTGSDEKNEKSTYVSLRGLKEAEEDVARLSERALSALRSLPSRSDFLEALIRMLIEREK